MFSLATYMLPLTKHFIKRYKKKCIFIYPLNDCALYIVNQRTQTQIWHENIINELCKLQYPRVVERPYLLSTDKCSKDKASKHILFINIVIWLFFYMVDFYF